MRPRRATWAKIADRNGCAARATALAPSLSADEKPPPPATGASTIQSAVARRQSRATLGAPSPPMAAAVRDIEAHTADSMATAPHKAGAASEAKTLKKVSASAFGSGPMPKAPKNCVTSQSAASAAAEVPSGSVRSAAKRRGVAAWAHVARASSTHRALSIAQRQAFDTRTALLGAWSARPLSVIHLQHRMPALGAEAPVGHRGSAINITGPAAGHRRTARAGAEARPPDGRYS